MAREYFDDMNLCLLGSWFKRFFTAGEKVWRNNYVFLANYPSYRIITTRIYLFLE
jgi:hypothetical protein